MNAWHAVRDQLAQCASVFNPSTLCAREGTTAGGREANQGRAFDVAGAEESQVVTAGSADVRPGTPCS